MCDPWDSQTDEKMPFLFILHFALTFFIRNENITLKTFEIILHVGQVTSLQSCKVVKNRTFIYKGMTVT